MFAVVRIALLALGLVACGAPEEAELLAGRIRGWPPAEVDRAHLRRVVAPEVPLEGGAPDAGGEVTAHDAGETDTPPTDVLPCAQLVALACELAGPHDDRCHEARANPPDDSHGPTREGCAELLGKVQETEVSRGTACHRYVKALCAVHGGGSERCVAARSTVSLARTRREQRICQADWLLLEARVLRK
jgi:hypothetical protein